MLHRFESFTPRNIDTRQERMRLMKEKDLKDTKELAARLNKITSTFKDLKIDDRVESFFINRFIDCKIKINTDIRPNTIYFFNQSEEYLGEYNIKDQEFHINYPIWIILEHNYHLAYYHASRLIKNWIEKHFKLKSITVTEGNYSGDRWKNNIN